MVYFPEEIPHSKKKSRDELRYMSEGFFQMNNFQYMAIIIISITVIITVYAFTNTYLSRKRKFWKNINKTIKVHKISKFI